MFQRSFFLALAASLAATAQSPTAPVISARGVTNFFTQEPAPGTVGLGAVVQIAGLNLGPPEGAKANGVPWPTKLADVEVAIGGKAAPLYSVTPGTILAQVPVDANVGLVDVIVKRDSGASAPAKVMVLALDPAVRTADDSGAGAPWGTINATAIATTADGLGAADGGVPKAPLTAYVGGLRAAATAAASDVRPAEFDVKITVPAGARPGDLITLLAARQPANLTVFQTMAAPEVQFLPLPDKAPVIASLTDAGVNGSFLLATSARSSEGCYAAIGANMAAKSLALVSDCLTSVNAATLPAIAPNQTDAIGALVGPPSGDAQSGISSTVKIFSAAGDPLTINLPSAASTLGGTLTGFSAVMPGKPPQVAVIDPVTGDMQVNDAPAGAVGGGGAAGGGAPGTPASPTVSVDGLKHVFATAALGQGRLAVIVGDDALKPVSVKFAILNATGDATGTKDFPAGWLPLLNAVQPVRAGQNAPASTPSEPAFFDPASRLFFALARAADASKDAFIAFSLGTADPRVVAFPDGWFAASCTADMRLFNLDLVHQVALAGSNVAEPAFQASCPSSGFVMLDLSRAAVTAIPLPDQGSLRVPTTRADTTMDVLNNFVFGVSLDTTRAGTSDRLYVLDGVNGSAFTLPVPTTVNGFTDASVQQIPEISALLVQSINRVAGDQGLVLFNLDRQTVANLPVPDGFTTVASLSDGATVCCLVTRKIVARALKQGGSSVVIYDLVRGDITLPPNPDGITSIGPPPTANPGGQPAAATPARLVFTNARANTVAAVAYNGNRQAGIIVIRVP